MMVNIMDVKYITIIITIIIIKIIIITIITITIKMITIITKTMIIIIITIMSFQKTCRCQRRYRSRAEISRKQLQG